MIPEACQAGLKPARFLSAHGISQTRILELVAISFFRGSSWPRNRTCFSYTGRQVLLPLSHLGSPQVILTIANIFGLLTLCKACINSVTRPSRRIKKLLSPFSRWGNWGLAVTEAWPGLAQGLARTSCSLFPTQQLMEWRSWLLPVAWWVAEPKGEIMATEGQSPADFCLPGPRSSYFRLFLPILIYLLMDPFWMSATSIPPE